MKVGDTGTLQKCKHRWNNGRRVRITEIRDGNIYAEAIQPNKKTEEGTMHRDTFLIGPKNFRKD